MCINVYLSTFLFHERAWAHYLSGSLGIQTQTEAISVSMWPNLMRHGCEGTHQKQQPNGARVHRCVCVCEWVCSGRSYYLGEIPHLLLISPGHKTQET